FEHFEGSADSDFIREAWRGLKPGGVLCILPLFMSERFSVITDPLVDRRGVVWDPGVEGVEIPWGHTRFAGLYDTERLRQRVLEPGGKFRQVLYHMTNASEVHPRISLHFALVMTK